MKALPKPGHDLDNFIDTMRNASEFETIRFWKSSLLIAMQVRNYEPNLLHHTDKGWFLDGTFLGKTAKQAYRNMTNYW